MADINKTVGIIFSAETGGAEAKLTEISKAVDSLGKTDAAGLAGTTKGIDDLGKSATTAGIGAKELGDGLRKLADDAGVPAPVLDGLDGILRKIGSPVGGTAIAAAAAIAALAITFAKIGYDANTFKATLDNVSGGAIDTEKAFQFVIDVTKRIESNLNETLEAYERFLIGLQGTGLAAGVAEQAFEGILKAVEGIGGSSADAQKGLDVFTKVIFDGKIKLNEFDDIARAIPGGLRILADSIGVPVEQLREFAGKAGLGKEAIEAWAAALKNQDYDTIGIGGVTNAFNDLLTTIKLFGIELGASGAAGGGLSIIETALRSLTVATTIGAESITYWGATFANAVYTITNLDFGGFLERQTEIQNKFNAGVLESVDKLTGFDRKLKEVGTTGAYSIPVLADEFGAVSSETEKASGKTSELDALLKTLGVDPKKLKDPLIDFGETLTALINSPEVRGDQILAGFEAAIKKATDDDLQEFKDILIDAFESGKVSAEQAAKGIELIEAAEKKLEAPTREASKAIAEQEKELKRTEEAAAKFALELEKLASNERIKTLEFKAEIDVARIQADAEKVTAAFQSINTGIESTGDVLGNLFGLFDKLGNLDSSAYRAVFDQIDKENALREKSFNLQEKLTQAQIDNLNAQTKALAGGDAIIKIDGAGLQPHLEAFMWEILKAVQVRANRDGMAFLLGV